MPSELPYLPVLHSVHGNMAMDQFTVQVTLAWRGLQTTGTTSSLLIQEIIVINSLLGPVSLHSLDTSHAKGVFSRPCKPDELPGAGMFNLYAAFGPACLLASDRAQPPITSAGRF
jgi:hypothetical protein